MGRRSSFLLFFLISFVGFSFPSGALPAAEILPNNIPYASPYGQSEEDPYTLADDTYASAGKSFGKGEEDPIAALGYCPDICPTWYGEVEWLLLHRTSGAASQPLLLDDNTGLALLSTNGLDFGVSSGVRVVAGERFDCGLIVELGYLGWFDGGASQWLENTNPDVVMTLPDELEGLNVFYNVHRVRVDRDSRVNSCEINFACCCCKNGCHTCQSFEWLAGFRYFRVDESLRISAERLQDGAVETGLYAVETSNNLYGGQVGARVRRGRGRWRWEGTAKAGMFGNDAEQTQSITDYPDFAARPTTGRSGTSVAFVGELNVSAVYRLGDMWGVRAGYNLIWVQGVALAPDQLDFTFDPDSGTRLADGAGFLLHGLSLGIEARW